MWVRLKMSGSYYIDARAIRGLYNFVVSFHKSLISFEVFVAFMERGVEQNRILRKKEHSTDDHHSLACYSYWNKNSCYLNKSFFHKHTIESFMNSQSSP